MMKNFVDKWSRLGRSQRQYSLQITEINYLVVYRDSTEAAGRWSPVTVTYPRSVPLYYENLRGLPDKFECRYPSMSP